MKKHIPILSLVILAVFIGACSGKKSPDDSVDKSGAATLYLKAKKAMDTGQLEIAISFFRALESRYPFNRYALQAQLDLAYAYYKFNQPERAIAQADRFIRLNPTHEHVDYAYYIKGLSNFVIDSGFLSKWFLRNPADFDQAPIQESFKNFVQLLRKFPDSIYAPDARQRLIHLRNILAEHDINVARFYMKRKAYVAALNRAKYVLENFNESPSNIDAIAIMVEAYRELKMDDLAKNAERILVQNSPQHPLLHKKS